MAVRYVHTNLVARDWLRLAQFYQNVFGCTPVGAERDLLGEWLESATAIPNVRIRGRHLRLPGYGDDGPTLEIFQYEPHAERETPKPNLPGFGHIAFAVDDVQAVMRTVVRAGGTPVGERVRTEIAGAGVIEFQYFADPEGNIVEIQRWE